MSEMIFVKIIFVFLIASFIYNAKCKIIAYKKGYGIGSGTGPDALEFPYNPLQHFDVFGFGFRIINKNERGAYRTWKIARVTLATFIVSEILGTFYSAYIILFK